MAILQTLLGHQCQGLTHGINHGDGCSVVVRARCTPTGLQVLADHGHIQVPIGHLGLTGIHLGQGAGPQAERGHTRGAPHALLCARIASINLPIIQSHGDTADRGHSVHHQQTVVLLAQLTNAFHWLQNTRAGLSVGNPHQVRLVLLQSCLDLRKAESCTIRRGDVNDVVSVPPVQIHGTLTKVPVDADQVLVSLLCQVGHSCFPCSRPCTRHRHSEGVLGLPHISQQVLDLLHDLQEAGVHVPNLGQAHGGVHTGVRILRSWAEQHP
mmetsp:Transcript_18333/g.31873  ORF Transcript_18333/g.31873 Transcript_18333/m.31873 type:complete len:268 (-) Transcript_18333:95-898(-)